MRKRLLTIGLATLMAISITACGGNSKKDDSKSTTTTAKKLTTEEKIKKLELDYNKEKNSYDEIGLELVRRILESNPTIVADVLFMTKENIKKEFQNIPVIELSKR